MRSVTGKLGSERITGKREISLPPDRRPLGAHAHFFEVLSELAETKMLENGQTSTRIRSSLQRMKPLFTLVEQTAVQPRNRAGMKYVCLCAVALSTISLMAQIPPEPPPLGSLIDIGGRRIHLHCTGNGSPTVVVENGDDAFSIDWALVQPGVSRFTRICTYDRAGYAWSDPGPITDMVDEISGDLRLVLQTAEIKPPYVLVGASMGGAYIRAYQRRNPGQVVGMVFVDATADEGIEYEIDGKSKPASLVTADELRAFMTRLLARNPPPPKPPTKVSPPFDRLPENLQSARVWALAKMFSNEDLREAPYAGEAMREEFVALKKQRLQREPALGDLPLIVLARAKNTTDSKKRMQAELASLSRVGKLIIADQSDHEIHLYQPDLVIQAIKSVVDASTQRTSK
jgi:pimeloyl-ACP methyl ester carboxylesterase